MTAIDLIIDLHKNTNRQGPGSKKDTLQALDLIPISKNKNLKIADIGCGSGGQTISLAQHIDGKIRAVDLFPQFLAELDEKAIIAGVSDKINTLQHSMEDLPFEKESQDIIWSEGAIYNMGFENGIKKWRTYLKPKGYLAISEITWISHTRPKEINDFWNQAYPEIDTASNKIRILEENGYVLTGYFYLPENCWLENYYQPLEEIFPAFLKQHNDSEMAQNMVKEYRDEIALYQKFKAYYSYGFYIAERND